MKNKNDTSDKKVYTQEEVNNLLKIKDLEIKLLKEFNERLIQMQKDYVVIHKISPYYPTTPWWSNTSNPHLPLPQETTFTCKNEATECSITSNGLTAGIGTRLN